MAGDERFQAIGIPFIRGAHCLVCVFDVTDRNSFHSIDRMAQESLDAGRRDPTVHIPICVFGNKTDCKERVISSQEALDFCRKKGYAYMETSVKEPSNVITAFHHAVMMAVSYATIDQISFVYTDSASPRDNTRLLTVEYENAGNVQSQAPTRPARSLKERLKSWFS
eukprot:TRINITY_DN2535_c0_g1_i5.p1 TRINITY_DN2535_c0_g1~~TRINITY_DN2535_c0_g1_i5.p1  ORF type:complete len:167 (-),score=31.35 TRINITY_DN2535_c0_g1_i5:331-831(-)